MSNQDKLYGAALLLMFSIAVSIDWLVDHAPLVLIGMLAAGVGLMLVAERC